MNRSAEITAFVLARTNPAIDEIVDNVGPDEMTVKQLVGRLGAQGVLRREGDRVYVGDRGLAKSMAVDATGDYAIRAPEHRPTPSSKWTPPAAAAGPAAPPVTGAAATAKPGPKPRIPLVTAVQIRTGVPLPPPRIGRTSLPCPWPLATMEVGQMFDVEIPDGYEATDVANQIRKDIKIFDRLNPGRFFAVRSYENEELKRIMIGVWREATQPARGAHLKTQPAAGAPPPSPPIPPVGGRLVQPLGPDRKKVGKATR